MSTNNKPTYVRLPPELKSRLEREAERNSRTLTGEIIHRLRQSFEAKPADGASAPWRDV